MQTRYMKTLRWPSTSEEAKRMNLLQRQNKAKSWRNPNENWMAEKLSATGKKWTRQARWGARIFDFWCHEIGIAVEVDGPEHKRWYDNYRDEYNYRRSGILVLHVRNRNEDDATAALRVIGESESWQERRERLGIASGSKKNRRRLVSGQMELV